MQETCPNEITPFAQSELIKNQKVFNLNYTNQDFWSMKSRLVQFIKERFGENGSLLPNTFNDLVESDIAIMLIENWAFLADTLSFKMDQIVNELFIDTVTETENAFRLAKLVGFNPTPPIPSRSMWTGSLGNTLNQDVVIPTPILYDFGLDGKQMFIELFAADSDKNPMFDQDIIISAGQLTNSSIIGLEGITTTDSLTGTGEVLQSYTTSLAPVIYDSVSVKVDGVLWENVNFFSDSNPRREYRVEFDSDYRAYVMFGNNRAGLSPSSGSVIEITYRNGGGTRGNIVSGFLEIQQQITVSGIEYPIPVSFRNYTPGEYGYDGDNIEDIRRKLPEWVRTQDRAVTGSDYKTLSEQFVTPYHGQIGKANAVLRNYGCSGNIVDLYVLAKNGTNGLGEAGDELKADLYNKISEKKMLTDYVCVKNGTVVYVDVVIDAVTTRLQRKFEQEIRTAIQNKVESFFSLNNWEYGQDLDAGDLLRQLSDIKQVQNYTINFTTNDVNNSGSAVSVKFYEIIRPDTIEISISYE